MERQVLWLFKGEKLPLGALGAKVGSLVTYRKTMVLFSFYKDTIISIRWKWSYLAPALTMWHPVLKRIHSWCNP